MDEGPGDEGAPLLSGRESRERAIGEIIDFEAKEGGVCIQPILRGQKIVFGDAVRTQEPGDGHLPGGEFGEEVQSGFGSHRADFGSEFTLKPVRFAEYFDATLSGIRIDFSGEKSN